MQFDDVVVDLSAVDSADDAFRITTAGDIADLTSSIQGVGLLAPPLLSPTGTAGYRIIAGFRRTAACRTLGWDRMPARIVPPETSDHSCARLAVADNAFQRDLNPLEISRALTLLSAFCSDPDVLASTAGELGLPDTPDLIRKLLPLCTFPAPLQSDILSGDLSLSMAHVLSGYDTDLAVRLADLFRDLRLSLNKQREILTLLEEIALRENRSMTDLLQDDAVQSILSAGDADRNQRSAALRRWLKRRRYPEISRAEAAFEEALRDLPLGDGIQLTPPRHFESPVYSLTVHFKSVPELSRQHRRIGEMLSRPDFEKLLS